MNLVELAKLINDEQVAFSKELNMKIVCSGMGLFQLGGTNGLECDLNYLLTNDWEIELPYVDFWTAYQAARNEGWAIKSEHREYPTVVDECSDFSPREIDGRWQILDQ